MFNFWEIFSLSIIISTSFIAAHLGDVFSFFGDKKIEVLSAYFGILGLIVLIKYTYETQRIREDAKLREVEELRGYFGFDRVISVDSMGEDRFKIPVAFKNFGKTPLYDFKFNTSFRKRSNNLVNQISYSPAQTLNPDQVYCPIINVESRMLTLNNDFDIIFEATYKIYTKDPFKYTKRIQFTSSSGDYMTHDEKEDNFN